MLLAVKMPRGQAKIAPDPQRTIRLRENKRQSRLRQKQYTAELEARLRQLQAEGVKATKEVQGSARRVVEENIRLRALLRFKGIDDETINTWTPGGMENGHELEGLDLTKPVEQNPPWSIGTLLSTQHAAFEVESTGVKSPTEDSVPTVYQGPPSPGTQQKLDENPQKQAEEETHHDVRCDRGEAPCRPLSDVEDSEVPPFAVQTAPCKLISRLAENPSADITQIPVASHKTDIPDSVDGMECSKAYLMLMQFAITEEKLDTISRALEGGCVADKGSRSGCRVRNEVIWKAIDDVS